MVETNLKLGDNVIFILASVKCCVTLFSGNLTPPPLVMLITLDPKPLSRPQTTDLQYMTELANSPITNAADDIVVSLSGSFQLDFIVHNASDAVVPDSKHESATTAVDSLGTPTSRS